jgi:hypothetical protein
MDLPDCLIVTGNFPDPDQFFMCKLICIKLSLPEEPAKYAEVA